MENIFSSNKMSESKLSKHKKILIMIKKVMPKNMKEQFMKSAIMSFFKK